ncbi:MAG: hypothetical protein R2911_16715 [Caldilineaceae bacterium]
MGQWSLRMAGRIVDTYGIPVGLINGAVNGSEIPEPPAQSQTTTRTLTPSMVACSGAQIGPV